MCPSGRGGRSGYGSLVARVAFMGGGGVCGWVGHACGSVEGAYGGVAGKVFTADVHGELDIKDLIVRGLDALSARGRNLAGPVRSPPGLVLRREERPRR